MVSKKQALVSLELEGAGQLESALRALGNNAAIRKAITRALLIAAEPTAKMARSLAPKKTGELAEGIDVSTTLSRRQRGGKGGHVAARGWNDPLAAYVYIGAKPRGPAVIQEFGTVERSTKTGKSTGAVPAHPFMRPAWEAGKYQILADFQKLLWATIEEEANRLARKQAALIRKGRSKS